MEDVPAPLAPALLPGEFPVDLEAVSAILARESDGHGSPPPGEDVDWQRNAGDFWRVSTGYLNYIHSNRKPA
jgi:hypothetical protein